MANPLEHAEHISHAGHEGHGSEGDHEAHSKLGTYIGITMAVLGVVLAFCAARVGAERTELVQSLVEQQHAHAKYQAQDIKHRVAVSNLRQLHALIPAAELTESLEADLKKIDATAAAPPAAPAKPDAAMAKPAEAKPAEAKPADGAAAVFATTAAARALGKNLHDNVTPNKADGAALANNVDRYKSEADAANLWVESFNPAIKAHMEAQELFEKGQLLAEIGIVIASVALLIKKRAPWFVALALGAGALGIVGYTLVNTGSIVHVAEEKIEETGKEYRDLRTAHKASELDVALVNDVRKWAGVSAPPAPAHHGAEKPMHEAEPAHHQ